MKKNAYDTIIIGAGMAGLTAAIYAARKKMNFLAVAEEFGGQMNVSGEVLNYPGIIESTGAEMRAIMKKQAEFNGFEINEGERVERIEKENKEFIVITDKEKYHTKTIIIASGSRPRKLNIPGENKFANKGVHYCAICDGPLYSNKEVAIIGGGDSALEAVDFLREISSKIYILNIGEHFTAHQYLVDRIENLKNVEIIHRAATKQIKGNKFVSSIIYEEEKQEKLLKVAGVFIEIGRIPNNKFIQGLVKLDQEGHILVGCQMQTSIPGIYAAGDVTNVHEYQYVISAGQGCTALIKASRYLAGSEN